MTDSALAIVPVILAGGSGTRLWPLSRSLHPKQYLSLGGGGSRNETLFQQAALRLFRAIGQSSHSRQFADSAAGLNFSACGASVG